VLGKSADVFNEIKRDLHRSPGILNRNSVAFVMRKVAKGNFLSIRNILSEFLGLKYLHSKGYVHSQLSSTEVYMNEYCYVKLSGFGHARRMGSK
jgi:serine/threonine protein kinase